MTDSSQFLDIVIFAMIAVFLGLRLRSVLGRRNPDQEPAPERAQTFNRQPAPVIDLPSDPLSGGLARIAAVDPSFNPDQFLEGANRAFEVIVHAFAKGDLDTLRPLLSDKVFADFRQAIEQRGPNRDEQMELVRIVSSTLQEATLTRDLAEISVRFVSEQQAGDRTQARLIDLWRFARQLTQADPNWRLVATSSLDS